LATLKEIKSRIVSIKNTEKITRAMKMVAAVKFRRAYESVISSRPYSRKLDGMLKTLLPSVTEIQNDLLTEREIKRICLVVVAADRGLCGSFNTNIIKASQNLIDTTYSKFHNNKDLTIVTVGKKSYDYFSKRDFDIYAAYNGIFDKLNFNAAKEVVKELVTGYTKKDFDKIIIVYNEFKSVMHQKITEEQFLPIINLTSTDNNEQVKDKSVSNFIFEPSQLDIIKYLIPKQLNTRMWQVLLESNASEQASRMTAMDTATTNANDLISTLQISYNRERQAAITKELLEVVGGAESLRNQ
jgi:F-type H+-transporting ATPase subunit gamma